MNNTESYHEMILNRTPPGEPKIIGNPHKPSTRLIRPYGTHYEVLKPNPFFPNEGDVWFSEGRLYSLRGIKSLITQNKNPFDPI